MADDHIWLTYDEAAERLGVKPASVRRRAAARKWPKRQGNDRRARVGIPKDVIDAAISRDDATDAPTGAVTPGSGEVISAEIALARTEIATLNMMVSSVQRELERVEADRDRWHALATAHRPSLAERMWRAIRSRDHSESDPRRGSLGSPDQKDRRSGP